WEVGGTGEAITSTRLVRKKRGFRPAGRDRGLILTRGLSWSRKAHPAPSGVSNPSLQPAGGRLLRPSTPPPFASDRPAGSEGRVAWGWGAGISWSLLGTTTLSSRPKSRAPPHHPCRFGVGSRVKPGMTRWGWDEGGG